MLTDSVAAITGDGVERATLAMLALDGQLEDTAESEMQEVLQLFAFSLRCTSLLFDQIIEG
ncbi:hypothetical protein NUH86_19340 [Sphingobium sp. JS3065]|uniref:hypothetical protein n=1 Tax=Sphingobium sp. JS3065 TaxID=2970925 RepID=UPI002265068C|nr:hypothetical protein [Sphingobium sp. JS3065]UZW57722.1 hypothetical protein NUH86_19340 [Sphingobium sp. JS3065]